MADGTLAGATTDQIARLHERIASAETQLAKLDQRLAGLNGECISDADAQLAFSQFDHIWSQLSPREQARLLSLLIERVEYDADAGTVSVTFHPSGITALMRDKLVEAA